MKLYLLKKGKYSIRNSIIKLIINSIQRKKIRIERYFYISQSIIIRYRNILSFKKINKFKIFKIN